MRVRLLNVLWVCLIGLGVQEYSLAASTDQYWGVTRDVYLAVRLGFEGEPGGSDQSVDNLDTVQARVPPAVCQLGLTCAPPFTSPGVHSILMRWFLPGDTVTSTQLFRAVVANVLSHPHLADINVALLFAAAPTDSAQASIVETAGASVVAPYRRIAQSRREFETALQARYGPILAHDSNASSSDLLASGVVDDAICPQFASLDYLPAAHDSGPMGSLRAGSTQVKSFHLDDPVTFEADLLDSLIALAGKPHEVTRLFFGPAVAGGYPDAVYAAVSEIGAGGVWRGNLKKLGFKINAQGSGVAIVDANAQPALEFSDTLGLKLREEALTLWTKAELLPPADGSYIYPGADGQSVARGGAGQNIVGFRAVGSLSPAQLGTQIGDESPSIDAGTHATRPVFTVSPDTNELIALNATLAVQSRLSRWLDPSEELSDAAELDLIKWARGLEASAHGDASRDWLMGDMLGADPVVVNYGATAGYRHSAPNVRVFFGSGDGLFRIVQSTSPGGDQSGREEFAFLPPEILPHLRDRRENRVSAARKFSGVEGSIRVVVNDTEGDGTVDHESGDEVLVFFGLGRGGRSYYALDASDPSRPPVLLWRISATTGPAFAELGSTVSAPVPITLLHNGQITEAVVFGGGIGSGIGSGMGAELSDAADAGGSGNALYIVRARTGELLWKAVKGSGGAVALDRYEHPEMLDAFAAPVVPLQDAAGLTYRLYVGDIGGSVWRIDLPGAVTSSDSRTINGRAVRRIANLAAAGPGGDRRFFHALDVVRSRDAYGAFEGVVISSGDSENPLDGTTEDFLFYLKDRGARGTAGDTVPAGPAGPEEPVPLPAPIQFDDLPDLSQCDFETADSTRSEVCEGFAGVLGWKLSFEATGEKSLSAPLVDGGRVFATTYVPKDVGECSGAVGESRLYRVALNDASAISGKSRVYALGPGTVSPVIRVGHLLYIPGRLVKAESEGEEGSGETGGEAPFEPVFEASKATRLIDLYWSERGVDAL